MNASFSAVWKSLIRKRQGTPVRRARARPTLESLEDRLPLAVDPLRLADVLPPALLENLPPGLSNLLTNTPPDDGGGQPTDPPTPTPTPGDPGTVPPTDPFIPPVGTNPTQPTPIDPGSNNQFLTVQAAQGTTAFQSGTTSAPAADATLTRFALLSTERNSLNGPSAALAPQLVGRETPNDPFLPQGQGNGLVRFDFLGLGHPEGEEDGTITGEIQGALGGQTVVLEVLRDSGWTLHSLTTADPSGRFEFGDLPDGTYRVRVEGSEAPVRINATMPDIRVEVEAPAGDTTGQADPEAEPPSWVLFVMAGTVVCWPLTGAGKARESRRGWHRQLLA